MEGKMKQNYMGASILILIASLYANLLLSTFAVSEGMVELIKIALLMIVMMVFRNWKFALVLVSITVTRQLSIYANQSHFFRELFDISSFVGNFGASILLKVVGAAIVVGVLWLLYGSRDSFFLRWGDLSRKAEEISWLGIQADTITWKKLSVISGVLISFGTILLTLTTVLGRLSILKVDFFVSKLPYILVFSLLNALCEGILFRNAILGPLQSILERKEAVLLSAVFFGSFHYYGAPGGFIGVIMSTVLGWFLARSMVETKGLLAPWIIHFMQDFVIFSTIALLGNFLA